MTKKQTPEERYAGEVAKKIGATQRRVLNLFRSAIGEAALLSQQVDFDPDKPFTFDDYPLTKKRSDKLIRDLQKQILSAVYASVAYAWELAEEKNDELVKRVLGGQAVPHRRAEGVKSFTARREQGLNLSDRVWKYTDQFKEELEMSLDLGLRDGLDAPAMSRTVREYLAEPNKLFRRVRDVHGQLHLSSRAKAYHPGQGVYRSSYKNALRLTATETNMAYRTADYERIQELDFVRGIEVCLSNNHTLNGKPFHCICDEFAGKYPKGFKFVGWHPLCRCYVKTILSDDPFTPEGTPEVTDVPQGLKDWVANNGDRIDRAFDQGRPAYWLRDNASTLRLRGKSPKSIKHTLIERSKARHEARTSEQIEQIKKRWEERRLRPYLEGIPTNIGDDARFAIARNSMELEKALGITKGAPMGIDEADKQSANPSYTPKYIRDESGKYKANPIYDEAKAKPYSINCAACTPCYLLRLRGFNVTAMPNIKGSMVESVARGGWLSTFKNIDGSPIRLISTREWAEGRRYKSMTPNRYKEFYEENCREVGVYYVSTSWRGGGGHATILQRTADGSLLYVEPQVDNSDSDRLSMASLINGGTTRLKSFDGVFRIDDKLFNLEQLSILAKEAK